MPFNYAYRISALLKWCLIQEWLNAPFSCTAYFRRLLRRRILFPTNKEFLDDAVKSQKFAEVEIIMER
jgi:hypothetical protein